MKTGFELNIEQKQSIALTPELIQAIRILQYNAQELEIFIDEQLLANPMLESLSEEQGGASTDSVDNMITDINDPVSARRDADNSQEDKRREDFDWQEYMQQMDYSDVSYGQDLSVRNREREPDYTDRVSYASSASADPQDVSLSEHLMFQLQFHRLSEKTQTAARYIIESLDENGYLTQSPEEIAGLLGMSENRVGRALELIRSFDPPGIAAADLNECLLLQLKEKGENSPEAEKIVTNDLEDLAANRIAQIAKRYKIKQSEVQKIADKIRALEPKPGSRFFDGNEPAYIIPDVFIEKSGDEYVISVNESASPRLMISPYYRKLLGEGKNDPAISQFLSGRLDAALWLIKSIEHRKQTIYNVVSAVIRQQRGFFDFGRKQLHPLTLKKIADEIGIHESTVSRAVNGKYIQTPRGVFELRYFFMSGVSGSNPEGIAADGVKERISEMISNEDKKAPMSDQGIADRLNSEGIDISRRTVAKYRDRMGLPSSTMRRR